MMDSFLDLAMTRRSIRKYEDRDIPVEDIEYFIKAAINAPSGCNSQCWRFVAVKNRDVIKKIEAAVIKKLEDILKIKGEVITENYLTSKKKMVGFFAKAPVVIAVFKTASHYYDPIIISALKENGYDEKGIMELFSNYDVLSVGAAVQNLLLAVHEKGYGACWMNEPSIAGREINEILAIPEEQKFVSLIPVGVPAYNPKDKKMKEFDEVFSIV